MEPSKKAKNAKPGIAITFALLAVVFWIWAYGNHSNTPSGTESKSRSAFTNPFTAPPAPDSIDAGTKNVNPDSFKGVRDFVSRIKPKPGFSMDLVNEPFVIVSKADGGETYVPITKDTLDSKEINDNRDKRNQAISDIFLAYKEGKIYRTEWSSGTGAKVTFGRELAHPFTDTLNGVFSTNANLYEVRDALAKKERLSKFGAETLAYLYEFEGLFDDAAKVRKKACKDFSDTCAKSIDAIFAGKALDQDDTPLAGVTVRLQWSKTPVETKTSEDGSFTLKFKTYPLSHVHLEASKLGYSDGFADSLVNFYVGAPYFQDSKTFYLNKADSVQESKGQTPDKDGYYLFKTAQSEYRVPKNGLTYADGTKFEDGDFTTYLYEFKKTSKIDSLANSPTFQPVYGYVGNIMKTFGMPYVQFMTPEGKELFVGSSNPILLKNRIYHMKELYEGSDRIYEPLTNSDMEELVRISEEKGGYPIDFKFLTEHDMLRWPAWWALDRKRGVWDNVPCRVIDAEGVVELPFWSFKDSEGSK